MPDHAIPVLYFSSFGHLRWGGQKSLYALVTNLNRQKFRPIVAVPEKGELFDKLNTIGIRTVVLNLPRVAISNLSAMFKAVRQLSGIIQQEGIRLLHTDGPRNTLYAGLVAKAFHIPLIWHIRTSERDKYDRFLCRFADRLVLVAGILADRFRQMPCSDKLTTIHNGIDFQEFEAASSKSAVTVSQMEISRDTCLLACIARVHPVKGQTTLIQACEKLKGKCDFHLFLIGEIADRSYYWTCMDTIENAGMKANVTFLGHQRSPVSFLRDMDIMILPSVSEAFPRAVIEAMAAGKPVIATDVGGVREAVLDGTTGFVVPPSQPDLLAEKILLLVADRERAQAMGKTGQVYCREHFSIARHVALTEQLYESCLRPYHD